MRSLVEDAGLQESIELDSAGTGAWHLGSTPDRRAAAAARARGIVLRGRARQVTPEDFDDFDMLLAMDRSNMDELQRLASGGQQRAKVRMLREFDGASRASSPPGRGDENLDVPDPYYGGDGGFETVLDLVYVACAGLLADIRTVRAP